MSAVSQTDARTAPSSNLSKLSKEERKARRSQKKAGKRSRDGGGGGMTLVSLGEAADPGTHTRAQRPRNARVRRKFLEGGSRGKFMEALNAAVDEAAEGMEGQGERVERDWRPEPAAKKKKPQLTSEAGYLQPRQKDYNGCGLARPSIFLSFSDLDFVPRFERQFAEHIEGFFGTTFKKAVKKDKARKEQEQRKKIMAGMDGMNADEKVEYMMRKGLL